MQKYYGLLGGAGFAISYSLAGLMWGKKINNFNRKQLISIVCITWSLTTLFTGSLNSFGVLIVMRVILGMSQAATEPAALSMMADAIPKDN